MRPKRTRDYSSLYIKEVAEIIHSLEWDKLYLEIYPNHGVDKIIAVLKESHKMDSNYYKDYEAVFQDIPYRQGIILPKLKGGFYFIDLSFGFANQKFEDFKKIARKEVSKNGTKRILDGGVLNDIIGWLSAYNRSIFYDIIYTPKALKRINVSDYDLSLLENLQAHGDALFVELALTTFNGYSYRRISNILGALCEKYVEFFLSNRLTGALSRGINLHTKNTRTLAEKDFYSHTKILFECYKPLFSEKEQRRVWNDVTLICDRNILGAKVFHAPQDIPCLNTKATVDELERLWVWLIENRHIDKSVSQFDFVRYFRREAGELPTRKLLWTGQSKEVLFAVIEILHPCTERTPIKKKIIVKTIIKWDDINAIIEAPDIKIDRLNYRSTHRRPNSEIVRNKYSDMVDVIISVMQG